MRRGLLGALLVVGTGAFAATPSEGVEFHARRGFFAETDLGTFFTVGGNDHYSNLQTYLQLGLGFDLGERLELGAQFGLGASNVNCFADGRATEGTCTRADSFTVSFLDASVTYLVPLRGRLYLTPRLLAGYTNLNPTPITNSNGKGTTGDPNVGAGVGVEYATSLDHFSVGADLSFRYVLGANIPSIAIFPRVKYTF